MFLVFIGMDKYIYIFGVCPPHRKNQLFCILVLGVGGKVGGIRYVRYYPTLDWGDKKKLKVTSIVVID